MNWVVALAGPAVALLAILVVGLAGQRRDAANLLIKAHSELTGERVNDARNRQFQVVGKEPHAKGDCTKDDEKHTTEINDYFVLLYAIETASVAVRTACMKRERPPKCWKRPRWPRIARGTLPKERADYLSWHLDAIMDTVIKWRSAFREAHPGFLDDVGAYDQLTKHCEVLRGYGVLAAKYVPSPDEPGTRVVNPAS